MTEAVVGGAHLIDGDHVRAAAPVHEQLVRSPIGADDVEASDADVGRDGARWNPCHWAGAIYC